jgi:endonuclease YncB( thermonuclease family)
VDTGRQLNRSQVSAGWSRAYVYERRFQQYDAFKRSERKARRLDSGVWGRCAGDFHRPR